MTLLSHSFQGTESDSFSTKNKPRGSQVDHVCGLGRTVRGADTPASGSSPPVCARGPPREVLPAIDAAYLTGMMGEAGIFLTRCWLHTDRDVSKTFNHAPFPPGFLRTLSHLHWEMLSLGTEETSGGLSPAASVGTRLLARAKKP